MFPAILRDADVTQKLLDAIIDTPGGKRSVSRLARTCKAFCEPALNVLWRELDSIAPIIGLFPSALLKRVRRPGLGLVCTFQCHRCLNADRASCRPNPLLKKIGRKFWNMASACAVSHTRNVLTTSLLRYFLSLTNTDRVHTFFPTCNNSLGESRHQQAWVVAPCF